MPHKNKVFLVQITNFMILECVYLTREIIYIKFQHINIQKVICKMLDLGLEKSIMTSLPIIIAVENIILGYIYLTRELIHIKFQRLTIKKNYNKIEELYFLKCKI